MRFLLLAAAGILAIVAAAEAAERDGTVRTARGKGRAPAERVRPQPYEPDRLRPGSRPGFVDLGNGTEVRVSGRVRLDYDIRR